MEAKKSEGAGMLVVLYGVFLGLAIMNMSFAMYDRHRKNKEAKNKANKGGEVAKN